MRVEIEDLTLRYGRTVALDRLSVSLDEGKIYGLLGRNGAGKSSLLSVLAAHRPISGGTVRVAGEDPFENERLTRSICLIRSGGDVLRWRRCGDTFSLARALRPGWDKQYAESLAARFKLSLKKTPESMSLGQRSAFACILGLASRAPLTMFDESYLGMDVPARYAFVEELLADYARHPRTVIVSTQLIEDFSSVFEEVVMIDSGRLVLREETETLRSRGAAVTGPAEAVDRFVTGLNVLGERHLGGTKSATIYGALDQSHRRRAAADGLQLEPVPVQDLFVHLTATAKDRP